ncbi:DUF1593 domain-containing protein [Cecembia rubra]|uniref:Uncharacterized protein DUF1593 n=1 Tax=Cecembia rubra TaxID=1485585 RepID=A0A2P8DWX4_9BACT|nr:DUF1593 domain-containing protein [Cecembia rubra]PSL01729.1 uncharacterized protein DUF1593 [Cecembia rubra]
MRKPLSFLAIVVLALLFNYCTFKDNAEKIQPVTKSRTIVTTDGEVDDVDSFIRMLLYSNEFDLEGLIYSSSQWHYKGDGKGTLFISELQNTAERYGERTELRWPGTTWMQELISKYAEVYPNLQKHAKGYPSPEKLLNLVKVGNIEFEGEMEKDSEGSEWIKMVLLDDDPRPLYLQVWGGTNTIARALKSIQVEYEGRADWESIYRKISDKAIIYTVLDQDASYTKYIAPNWPDIKVIYNSDQFWCFAYPWSQRVPEGLKYYLSGEFFKEYILFDKGPLMARYFTWGDGRQIDNDPEHDHGDLEVMAKYERNQFDFISEGDSPAFFYLLDVGLRNQENPSFGGWGGRFIQSETHPNRWEDGKQVTDYNPYTQKEDPTFPQTRWIKEIQNDFAARAAWCVKNYEEANHAPYVWLVHPMNLNAKIGQKVTLECRAQDPDGDQLNYLWWQYLEPGTLKAFVQIQNAEKPKASFIIPDESKIGDTIHIILEVEDDGYPSLTRYQRVVVTVIP